MHTRTTRPAYALLLASGLMPLCGCPPTVQYIIEQGIGQISMMAETEPIDDVLASGRLDAEAERKLRLVVQARDFARDELGLDVGGSFQLYHETNGEPVGYNVSAAQQDALTPKRWQFPIVGWLDYIGFFSPDDARQAADELQAQGWDTYIYGVDAYSTLGWFADPLQSSFLRRSDGSIVETVIHELAHNTIYVNGQSTFNESLATFIGREGARRFYAEQGEVGEQMITALEEHYADQQRITTWMQDFTATLRAHYAQDVSSEEKVAGREALFQTARDRFTGEVQPGLNDPERYAGWANLPTNNAYVLLHQRYNLDLDVFAAVCDAGGGDFAAFLAALRAAAGAGEPFAHLRELAGSR